MQDSFESRAHNHILILRLILIVSPVSSEDSIPNQSMWIFYEQSDTGRGFSSDFFGFSVIIIPPVLHTDISFFYEAPT